MAVLTLGELSERLLALEKLTHKETEWIKTAIAADKASLSIRLTSMNEMRDALRDLSATMFTRNEHEAYQKLVEMDLRSLRESRSELSGKASQTNMTVTFIVAFSAALISLADVIFRIAGK